MNQHFADRVVQAVHAKGVAACVGLDPLLGRLPKEILRQQGLPIDADYSTQGSWDANAAAEALFVYGAKLIEIVAPQIPVLKINIAFFERLGAAGISAYSRLIDHAHQAGMIVIGDIKRADIGHSTTQYAMAHLGGTTPSNPSNGRASFYADAVTVNPYFGFDGIKPFVDIAQASGQGMFVLVQTSNKSAGDVQGITLSDGDTLCERIAKLVAEWSEYDGLVGESGYSCIGAVVSPRDLEATVRLRDLMPRSIFLVPGFGAQGRTAEEVARCFKQDGTGALITSSRGVIYAYEQDVYRDRHGDNWQRCIADACSDLVESIRTVCHC